MVDHLRRVRLLLRVEEENLNWEVLLRVTFFVSYFVRTY